MSKFSAVTRTGQVTPIESREGVSVMKHIRDAGSDELLAICGGCCSCAICHSYIDGEVNDCLPPLSVDDDELLDSYDHRRTQSRLSCQVRFKPELVGMIVTLAPEGLIAEAPSTARSVYHRISRHEKFQLAWLRPRFPFRA